MINEVRVINVTPEALVNLINEGIEKKLSQFNSGNPQKVSETPHLTKKETAKFFDVTVGCITDWCKRGILTPMKVGQRVYFSREECMRVMFNQSKSA